MRRLLGLALLFAVASAAHAAPPPEAGNSLLVSPAHNWVLPLFTPSGDRDLILRGDEAQIVSRDRIDVVDIDITMFSRDASNRITTIVLSPQASYFPKDNLASGPSSVRILHTVDNTEISGEDWTYDFRLKKFSIRRNARLILQQPLNDFLK